MDNLIVFILLALIAEVLGTVGGFGSSMFFVPMASMFLDFHSVLGVTAIFHVSSNLTKIFFFREGVNRKLVITIGIPAIIFVIGGAFLSKYLQSEWLELMLAIFLISLSLILLVFPKLTITPNTTNSVLGGALSGLVAGLLGTGGAIRGITMAAFNLETKVFIATSALIDLAIDLSRSAVYFSNGYIHRHDVYLVPILLAVSIAGTMIGKKILSYMSDRQFKSLVLVLVLITGIIALLKYFSNDLPFGLTM